MLLDPRREDPTEYLALDPRDTFWFVPRARKGTLEHDRAEYSIRVLRLNARDYLPKARQQAYQDYKAHLAQYRAHRDGNAPRRKLDRLKADVLCRQHPTVWLEMKRQHAAIPELSRLFRDVPEALAW